MDLYAYTMIEKYREEIEDILEHIPRLRGIRKMSDEKPQEEDGYQMQVFNSYCGKEDVYMIHARIGGDNWDYYEGDEKIATKPWFLAKVNDDFDETYCDIYVTTNYADMRSGGASGCPMCLNQNDDEDEDWAIARGIASEHTRGGDDE